MVLVLFDDRRGHYFFPFSSRRNPAKLEGPLAYAGQANEFIFIRVRIK